LKYFFVEIKTTDTCLEFKCFKVQHLEKSQVHEKLLKTKAVIFKI